MSKRGLIQPEQLQLRAATAWPSEKCGVALDSKASTGWLAQNLHSAAAKTLAYAYRLRSSLTLKLHSPHRVHVATDRVNRLANLDIQAGDTVKSYRAVHPELFMCSFCPLISVAIKLGARLLP